MQLLRQRRIMHPLIIVHYWVVLCMGAEANRFASATTMMGRLDGDKKPSPGAKQRSHNIYILFKVEKKWGIFLLSVPLLIDCWKRKVSCLFCEQKMYIYIGFLLSPLATKRDHFHVHNTVMKSKFRFKNLIMIEGILQFSHIMQNRARIVGGV